MGQELKLGDRVRITAAKPVPGYRAGSKGVVRSGPTPDKDGQTYYGVQMDKDGRGDAALFLADEIEPDV